MSLRNLLAEDLIEADFRGEAMTLESVLASASLEVLDELRRECEEHDDWPELEIAVEAEISTRYVNA